MAGARSLCGRAVKLKISNGNGGGRMKTYQEHVTMDRQEAKLLERYETQFGETPPVGLLDPQRSKRMIMDAFRNNRPFNEKDLESKSDFSLIRRAVHAARTTKTSKRPARSMRAKTRNSSKT